jgi:hypothetical protein
MEKCALINSFGSIGLGYMLEVQNALRGKSR